MKIEVLVAAMNQCDHKLLEKMNIRTDAIVGNQCDRNEIEEFIYNDSKIRYLSFCEKGVGLNRNNALMRSTGDICLIADDDMRYVDNYELIVEKAFRENQNVDVIIFNLYETKPSRYIIKNKFKVNKFNYTKFGAARLAIKRESIVKNGIFFNTCFGGGAKYSAGEDTIFLKDCIKNKLKIIAVPEYIAYLEEDRPSTWFNGYNEKLLMDTGASYSILFKSSFYLRALYFCIKRYNDYKEHYTLFQAFKLINLGANKFKSNKN